MPNIMLTYRCNLNCSYCFAREFVHKENTDITVKNFMKAVSFLTNTGNTHVGLIGGEPTLHPVFQLFMEMLIANPKVTGITLYTNGLLMDQFIPQIIHPKVTVLVNCNSPRIIGEKAFTSIQQNLDTLIWKYYRKEQINLGINLYSIDMDYSFIVELLQRYKMHHLRISLSVPDFSSCGDINVLSYFRKYKEFLLEFFRKMDSINVLPYYNCNFPPSCIWTDEERKWLEEYAARFPDNNSNLASQCSVCSPVIDILPNLQAVRCFGMSDFLKVPIDDFKNVQDLSSFFMNEIDANAYKISSCEECKDCYEQKTRHCSAGCMGFKSAKIHACNNAIGKL